MTRVVALLGWPLGHSVSAAFQQAAFDRCGLDARYEPWETRPEALAERVAALRAPKVLGGNVTIPHKEPVVNLLDEVDPEAGRIGAVNTIVRQRGRLLGYNTDAVGFLQALREAGFDPQGRRALVVGAGGAARAVVATLLDAGAAVTVANRSPARAQALAAHFGVSVAPSAEEAAQGAELIVNCTPVGMKGGPEGLPLDLERVRPGAFVYDLVANPPQTPLLAAARARGCRTLGGLPMLVYQGAASFRLWTGREPPVEVMMAAARRALGLAEGAGA